MKITILGNNGPFPGPGGACSGYLLSSESGETNLLIECGSGVLARLGKFISLEALSGIVLSHLHFDHMSDMTVLKYQMQFTKLNRNIPVLCPSEPAQVFDTMANPNLDFFEPEDFTVGEMRVSFVPATHPVPSVSVKVTCDGATFVYTGDTNENPYLELFADGANLLLADAGLSQAQWSPKAPHLSARMCGELAKRARVGAMLLTHLRPGNDPDELLNEARVAYPASELAKPEATYYI